MPEPESANLKLGALACTALAPGLWRIALPFPSPLGHSYSYLLECDGGFLAVDVGWDSDDGWNVFRAAIERAGWGLDDLRGVVVTHAHPDHYGLTRRVRQETDAWIGLHPDERAQLTPRRGDRDRRIADIETWLVACGVPSDRLDDVMADRTRLAAEFPANLPTRDVLGGDAVPGTGGALVAIHTPGHTPGHLVFHERDRDVLFTGDHLLPRVSANVSWRPTASSNPLADYEESLGKVERFRSAVAAPGHEWSFDKVDRRVVQMQKHHHERVDETVAALHDGASSVWEVAHAITWSRDLSTLNARGLRSAVGETAAHLIRLESTGATVRTSENPLRWSLVARPLPT